MAKKSGLSIEQKAEAVLSMIRKEEATAQIARRYGISDKSLYLWNEQFVSGGKASLNGSADKGLRAEIEQLRKEIDARNRIIGELTIANTILKKK